MATAANERQPPAPWLRDTKLEHPGPAIEKMPQFRDSLERFSENAGEALAAIFGPGCAGTIEAIDSSSSFALLDAHKGHMAAVLECATFGARLLMILDPRIVDIFIGAMFGADTAVDDATPRDEAPARARTDLETRIVIEIAKALTTALKNALAPAANYDLEFASLDTLDEDELLGHRDMPAVAANFAIKTPGGPFGLILVLPQTLTAPLGDAFAQDPSAGGAKLDPNWSRQMERGVTQARLTLTAILDEFEMTLREISELAVGRLLPLTGDGEGRIRIECGERGVFVCKLGERNGRYALEVEDIIARQADSVISAAAV